MSNQENKHPVDELLFSLPREKAPEDFSDNIMKKIRTGDLEVTYHPRIVEATEVTNTEESSFSTGRARHYMELIAATVIVAVGITFLYRPNSDTPNTIASENQSDFKIDPSQLMTVSANTFEKFINQNNTTPPNLANASNTIYPPLKVSSLQDPLGRNIQSQFNTRENIQPTVSVSENPTIKNYSKAVPGQNLVKVYRSFVNKEVFEQIFPDQAPELLIVSNLNKLPSIKEDGPFDVINSGSSLSGECPSNPTHSLMLKTVTQIVEQNYSNGRVLSWEVLQPKNEGTSPVLKVTCLVPTSDTSKFEAIFNPSNLVLPEDNQTHNKKCMKVVGKNLEASKNLDFEKTFNCEIVNVRSYNPNSGQTETYKLITSSDNPNLTNAKIFDLYCREVRLNLNIEH